MSKDGNDLTFPTRERILRYILRHGSTSGEKDNCTVKTIAASIGLSSNVVWNYLVRLEKDGFVTRNYKQGKTGRPAMTYSLSEKGFELFPKSYMEFCITILDEIKNIHGEDEIKKIFSNIGKKAAEGMKKQIDDQIQDEKSPDPLKNKLIALVKVLEGHGTFHELLESEDSYRLKNYNCLTHGVVKVNPLVCTVDETLIHELIGQKPIKEKCFGDGDSFCVFRIEKQKNLTKTN